MDQLYKSVEEALHLYDKRSERLYSLDEVRKLAEHGLIAVVDFHFSSSRLFRRWMRVNHVEMQGHLLPVLEKEFRPVHSETAAAYLGLWQYVYFLGSLNQ